MMRVLQSLEDLQRSENDGKYYLQLRDSDVELISHDHQNKTGKMNTSKQVPSGTALELEDDLDNVELKSSTSSEQLEGPLNPQSKSRPTSMTSIEVADSSSATENDVTSFTHTLRHTLHRTTIRLRVNIIDP